MKFSGVVQFLVSHKLDMMICTNGRSIRYDMTQLIFQSTERNVSVNVDLSLTLLKEAAENRSALTEKELLANILEEAVRELRAGR